MGPGDEAGRPSPGADNGKPGGSGAVPAPDSPAAPDSRPDLSVAENIFMGRQPLRRGRPPRASSTRPNTAARSRSPGSARHSMKKYVSDGTVKAFELWNPANLGCLAAYAAADLASGSLKVSPGATFTAGKLGSFTIGAGSTVLLGPPTVFTSANISNFNF